MAEIKVNESQWNGLSEEERRKIIDGLRQAGSIKADDTIVADSSVPEFTANSKIEPMSNPLENLCKAGCDVVAATAVAWCTANTAGLGLAACIAAAEAARNLCKEQC